MSIIAGVESKTAVVLVSDSARIRNDDYITTGPRDMKIWTDDRVWPSRAVGITGSLVVPQY